MKLVGAGGQQRQDALYPADVTLTGSAQLVLGRSMSRSSLILQNRSASNVMYVEIGSARAHCSLTNGTVGSTVTVDNSGFNFTYPPVVRFVGGGAPPGGYPNYLGLNQPNGPSPSDVALGHAVLSGSSVGSVVVDHPGAGYLCAPFVFIFNDDLDPYGCATPSSSSGFVLPAGMTAPISWNGTTCPTDSVSVTGTSNDTLLVRWMD